MAVEQTGARRKTLLIPGIGVPGFAGRERTVPPAFAAFGAAVRSQRREELEDALEQRAAVRSRHQAAAQLTSMRREGHR